jgi:hypothetical protein
LTCLLVGSALNHCCVAVCGAQVLSDAARRNNLPELETFSKRGEEVLFDSVARVSDKGAAIKHFWVLMFLRFRTGGSGLFKDHWGRNTHPTQTVYLHPLSSTDCGNLRQGPPEAICGCRPFLPDSSTQL